MKKTILLIHKSSNGKVSSRAKRGDLFPYLCIWVLVTVFLFTSFSPAHAELKTFVKEYTYQASEDDSRNSSRTITLREVKRLLLEELGTCVMGDSH